MADKKKTLLEETSVRKFMKIAGLGKQTDDFLKKKVLNEESTGRGRIFDPHGDDSRHENLNEEDVQEEAKVDEDVQEEAKVEEDVQEESKGKLTPTGPGKAIESGKGLSGTGKKPTKQVQHEAKGKIAPTGPGKTIESGKGLSGTGKKPTKQVQFEEKEEDASKLDEELGDEMPPEPVDSGLGGEVPGDEMEMGGEGGDVDVSSLVRAIANAITQETGVPVSVEDSEGGGGLGDEPPEDDLGGMEPEMGSEPSPEMGSEEEDELEEAGLVNYKHQDPAAKAMSGKLEEAKKKKKASNKQQLVEAITRNVLNKISEASKKKVASKEVRKK